MNLANNLVKSVKWGKPQYNKCTYFNISANPIAKFEFLEVFPYLQTLKLSGDTKTVPGNLKHLVIADCFNVTQI